MNKINPNHPATPSPFLFEDGFSGHATGLTIRAELAARMPGLATGQSLRVLEALTSRPAPNTDTDLLGYLSWEADADAAWRVMQADALIAELNKTPGSDTGQK